MTKRTPDIDALYKKYDKKQHQLSNIDREFHAMLELNLSEADKMSKNFEVYRQEFTWRRSIDKNGDYLDIPQRITLCDISDEHLQSLIIWTINDYPPYIHVAFCEEQKYREKNNISVGEYE